MNKASLERALKKDAAGAALKEVIVVDQNANVYHIKYVRYSPETQLVVIVVE